MSGSLGGCPYVAASPQADAQVARRIELLIEVARSCGGDRLRALVLTGSLARGEGVAFASPSRLHLLSDIDLYAVVDPPDPNRDAQLAEEVSRAVADDEFLLATLDFGVVGPDYFARQGSTLPARQAQHGARVVWSGPKAWPGPPSGPGSTVVDPDDACKLLHNRLAEHLLLRSRYRDPRVEVYSLFHRWKLWLDAPLAFLAAYGAYAPGREEQMDRLANLTQGGESAVGEWAEAGIARARFLRRTMTAGALGLDQLREAGGVEGGDPYDPRSHEALQSWVWPFQRALLARGLGGADPSAASRLREAVAAGPPGPADVEQGRRWLRRRGRVATLREARRWAPLAGFATAPWWKYGGGGSGPDRIHLAAAWRFAGLPEWRLPLAGLLPGERTGSAEEGRDGDAWLGRLWSSWIMGGARR